MTYYIFSKINGVCEVLAIAATEPEAETALLNTQDMDLEDPSPHTIGLTYIKSESFNEEETEAINSFKR